MKNCPVNIYGSAYTLKRAFAENTCYGYAESVMEYAGLTGENILYLPLLEHGIYLDQKIDFTRYNKNMSYIFQGRHNEQLWRNRRKKVPCYYIGPYIYYAKNYYDEEYISKIKAKLGRTLLVFPPHTTEYEEIDLNLKNFDNFLFETVSKDYDSIIACVFWRDVDSKYTLSLESKGVKIMSAGFKLDSNFVKRLKTIISLSDCVIYPSFTTSIGYAFSLKKRVICNNCEKFIDRDSTVKSAKSIYKTLSDVMEEMKRLFNYDTECFTKEQKSIIEKYWGLEEIKTPDEIRKIYFENKHHIRSRLGF